MTTTPRLAVIDLSKLSLDAVWILDTREAILSADELRHLASCAQEREQLVLERLGALGVDVPAGERVPVPWLREWPS